MAFSFSGSRLLVPLVFSWHLSRLNFMTLNFGTGPGVSIWISQLSSPYARNCRCFMLAIFVWTFSHRSYYSIYLNSSFHLCPLLSNNVCFNLGPTFFAAFCSGCKEAETAEVGNENVRSAGGFQKFQTILHGLADCFTCFGNGIEVSTVRDPPSTPLLSF